MSIIQPYFQLKFRIFVIYMEITVHVTMISLKGKAQCHTSLYISQLGDCCMTETSLTF